MGERAVTGQDVIDETFAGLAAPAEIHLMGRPDLSDGRPGQTLVDEVRRFEAEGGFKEIAKSREDLRRAEEAADATVVREALPDFGITLSGERQADLEATETGDGH